MGAQGGSGRWKRRERASQPLSCLFSAV
jgi:hypothetical protein